MVRNDQILAEISANTHHSSTIEEKYIGKQISSYYGVNVFNDEAMRTYLPYQVYEKLQKIIKSGSPIDDSLAEGVAHGMKEWAMDNGVTHYTHWFQPLTGSTAEKHDSFLSFDNTGKVIERFSGKNLKQGEPDASSFPSGGLRTTFEARGYTAWDPTSPAFIVEGINGKTLCIPTAFFSYTGDVLDQKTPLLRSTEKLSDAALRILKIFGNTTANAVFSTVGPEQEYFLIDKAYFYRRPDIYITGRSLFGAKPPKGQQMEDHYFGSIKDRILAYMQEVEVELYKLGIPAKTRHNEVAPCQFELAQIFETSNLANDHNQMVMEVLRKVASKHNLALLLHEKPFAGVNGSGKHNNWSLSDSDGKNLLDAGKTVNEQLQFLTVLVATIKAVYKYSDLLRAAVASPGNDHRLGANEAPPAIISVFLGEELDNLLDNLETNKEMLFGNKSTIDLGISNFPKVSKDTTDRNRTSPFAFTGNKFEFRAVGSSHSIARANFTTNIIVTEILNEFADKIESKLKEGLELKDAVLDVIIPAITESKPVRFEGNNYTEEWEKEAERRGLPNHKTTPEALKCYEDPKNIELFEKYGILTKRELEALHAIQVETYIKTINIEAETALTIAKTNIKPSVLKYQTVLAENISKLASAGIKISDLQKNTFEKYNDLVGNLFAKIEALSIAISKAESIESEEDKAEFYCKEVLSKSMAELRTVVDSLEEETDSEYWDLPKYSQLLFVY